MLLERLLIWLIRAALVVGAVYLAQRWIRALPPWKWLAWAVRSGQMRQALTIRNQIAKLVRDRKATPDSIGLLCDVDSLVDSVVELLEVRGDLGARDGMTTAGGHSERLQTAVARTDQHLEGAMRRLDDIRACLLEFAADRMEEALADARTRFRDRAEQLGYTVDAHRELQQEIKDLYKDPGDPAL
ncbi:MAG: hypothetical protein EXR77_02890 [Myxococcales bacterium]|nr:hypothetical protein [Myxococcales bacterium]